MSLYELAFPDPERGPRLAILCGLLDLDMTGLRPRDAWVELVGDELRVALYTRVGGGNRDDYQEAIEAAQAHPLYLGDRDDASDTTYATFRFGFPAAAAAETLPEFEAIARRTAHVGEVDSSARWDQAIADVAAGRMSAGQRAGFDQFTAALRDALNGDGPPIVQV